jgi:sulfotransferase family protein
VPADKAVRLRTRFPEQSIEPALSLADWRDAERLFRARRETIVPVAQPLVLISQIQRSGGTLINTLLDGHPELHVHPFELHIGHPTKFDWPSLDMEAGPDQWLENLSEPALAKLFEDGYRKGFRDGATYAPLPFALVPSFIDHLFRLLCREREVRSRREAIDLYFTALFNAWIDNQGLREQPKRWVVGFAPRVAWGDSRARFREDYPDGRLLACLRDPRAWYASASRFSDRYADFDEAMALWRRGAGEIAAAKREAPDRVLVLTYEALVADPRRVMGELADWLGISWHPLLLAPTVNRMPTVSNSSYDHKPTVVSADSLEAWRRVLSDEVAAAVEAEAMELYSEVRSLADLS